MRYLLISLIAALGAAPALSDTASLSGNVLYEQVRHYASFGAHRTGTDADRKTSQWLSDNLVTAGFAVDTQPFQIRQFFPDEQYIHLENGESITAFPHWFPKPTEMPIRAQLAPMNSDSLKARIAYLSPDQAGIWYRLRPAQLAEEAAAKGALALIIAAPHPSAEIYATNAAGQDQVRIPTVVIAASDSDRLTAALDAGQTIELSSDGRYQPVVASNIIAHYPARVIKKAPWVVVSTPSSGWFQCAGERGSGVALWLGLARYISTRETPVNWLFVANSGHELDMLGAHQSMEKMPAPGEVRLWLHLGASIAARSWQREGDQLQPLDRVHAYNRLYATPDTFPATQQAFAAVPDIDILPSTELNRAHSELGAIVDLGYPALGLVGSHHFFHTPGDTPVVTSPELLAPYGAALARLAGQLLLNTPVEGQQ